MTAETMQHARFIVDNAFAIAIAVFLLVASLWAATAKYLRERRCQHDGGVNEDRQCQAWCRKCGKSLGFIGGEAAQRSIALHRDTEASNGR